MKRIWILNHYASDMYFSEGGRHYYFAKYLKKMGYDPVIFCANSRHNTRSESCFKINDVFLEKVNTITKVPYVFIPVRTYEKNGISRVFNMIDFFRNVIRGAKQYGKQNGLPDVIIASSVHPLTLLAGIKLAQYFKVKCICEIRDLWPESIIVYFDRFKRSNPIIKLLYFCEKYIYKKADSIIFTMKGGYDYIKERGWEQSIPSSKTYYINNGVDLEQFVYNMKTFVINDSDLNNDEIFKVVYTGSIRKVNNLERLLDIAVAVNNPKIKFLVWGEGDELPKLKKRVLQQKIDNVVFKGKVEKKYIPYITSRANLNFAHNSDSPLFRFGISFNKIFDYFAAGRPILCDFKAKYNPVIESNAGVFFSSNDEREIANGIESFALMDKNELEKYCVSAKKAAEYYDFKNLTVELLGIINRTVKSV